MLSSNTRRFWYTIAFLIVASGIHYGYSLYQVKDVIVETHYTHQARDIALVKEIYEGNFKNIDQDIVNSCLFSSGIPDNIYSDYLKCNRDISECIVREMQNKGHFYLKFNMFSHKGVEFYAHRITPEIRSSIKFMDGVFLNYSAGAGDRFVFIQNTCNQKKLDERVYYTSHHDDVAYWDNVGRTITIDKYLVTNYDIKEYVLYSNEELENKDYEDSTKWYLPSRYLTRDQQKNYCHYYGKKLLKSHILDAVSYYPIAYDAPLLKARYQTEAYWTTNKDFVFKDLDSECRHIFKRGCSDKKFMDYVQSSVGWAGIHQLLGAEFESIENTLIPDKNLRASSRYIGSESKLHKIGTRIHWDGRGHTSKSLTGIEGASDNIGIGFRCYRSTF